MDPEAARFGPLTLAPAESRTLTLTATVPALSRGAYYVGVLVNADGAVDETVLGNNIARSADPVPVRDPAPDFVVTRIRPSSETGDRRTGRDRA